MGVTIGLAGGYGHTDADTAGGDLDIGSYQLASYAGWSGGCLYVDTTLGYARHRTDANRRVTTGRGPRTSRAGYEADQVAWSIAGGTPPGLVGDGAPHARPRPGFQSDRARRLHRAGHRRGQPGCRRGDHPLAAHAGRAARRRRSGGGRHPPRPRAEIAWVREHGDRDAAMTAHFEPAPTTTFEVAGPKLDRDRAAIGLGVTAGPGATSHLDPAYRGEIAGSDDHHGIAVTWRQRW